MRDSDFNKLFLSYAYFQLFFTFDFINDYKTNGVCTRREKSVLKIIFLFLISTFITYHTILWFGGEKLNAYIKDVVAPKTHQIMVLCLKATHALIVRESFYYIQITHKLLNISMIMTYYSHFNILMNFHNLVAWHPEFKSSASVVCVVSLWSLSLFNMCE